MDPSPRYAAFLKRKQQAVARGVFNISPVVVESASGALVRDIDGREYLDFAAGIGVLNVGHTHPRIVEAIREQAGKLTHMCYHVAAYEIYVELVERLLSLTPGTFAKKGMLSNSGAEAVENAVKIARHWTGRPGILCFEHAFHGRTLLAMTLTAKENPYKTGFFASLPAVHRAHYAYCYRCPVGKSYPGCHVECFQESLKQMEGEGIRPDQIAAAIVEPVLGEGGFVPAPREFFHLLWDWCTQNGVVLIADEIQTGFGRTGKMFAMEHWDVVPDLVVMAKSIAGGMPLSAVVGRADIMDSPQEGGLGGTYGGNPMACAAALAVLDAFEQEDLLQRAVSLGERLKQGLLDLRRQFPQIGDIRGLGAMMAMELVEDPNTKAPDARATKALLDAACRRGLILLKTGTHNNVIRFLLPLNTPDDQLQRGLDILEESLAEVYAN